MMRVRVKARVECLNLEFKGERYSFHVENFPDRQFVLRLTSDQVFELKVEITFVVNFGLLSLFLEHCI